MAKKAKATTPQAAEAPTHTETARPAADWIGRETTTTETTLREAREIRDQLLAELTAGADVIASLDSIEGEIDGHEKKLKRLADARAVRDARNTAEARKARHERARASLQEALSDARYLGEQVKDLLHVVSELGARLSAIAEKRSAIRSRVSGVIIDADIESTFSDRHRELRMALNALTLPDHLQRHLWSSGLGRTGIELVEPWFDLKPLSGMYAAAGTRDPDEVIAEAVTQLRRLANDALNAQREAA